MGEQPTQAELEAAACWDPTDRVPGRPATTAFRRRARLHQARWRERRSLPMGTQPIVPKAGTAGRPVGSRLPLDVARETGATFVSPAALAAAEARAAIKEPRQSIDWQRFWADLLWAPALAVNLFGELAADLALADAAVHRWWPDVPGTVAAVRFLHSPGRLDQAFTGSLVDVDVAFELDLGGGTRGVLGVVTAYADVLKAHEPKPQRIQRYRDIADRSAAFRPAGVADAERSDLLVLWLQHLLVLSMVQHPGGRWRWGRLVVVHPAGNVDFAGGCDRYRAGIVDGDETFASTTIERLLDDAALAASSVTALRDRYVVG